MILISSLKNPISASAMGIVYLISEVLLAQDYKSMAKTGTKSIKGKFIENFCLADLAFFAVFTSFSLFKGLSLSK
jgi:hypothetical protein